MSLHLSSGLDLTREEGTVEAPVGDGTRHYHPTRVSVAARQTRASTSHRQTRVSDPAQAGR